MLRRSLSSPELHTSFRASILASPPPAPPALFLHSSTSTSSADAPRQLSLPTTPPKSGSGAGSALPPSAQRDSREFYSLSFVTPERVHEAKQAKASEGDVAAPEYVSGPPASVLKLEIGKLKPNVVCDDETASAAAESNGAVPQRYTDVELLHLPDDVLSGPDLRRKISYAMQRAKNEESEEIRQPPDSIQALPRVTPPPLLVSEIAARSLSLPSPTSANSSLLLPPSAPPVEPKVSCFICMDDEIPASSSVTLVSCGHVYCTSCFKQYLWTKVSSGQVGAKHIVCPDPYCPSPALPETVVRATLTPGMWVTYERKVAEREISEDPSKAWCREVTCKGVVQLTRSCWKGSGKCGRCRAKHCNWCGEEPHLFTTCEYAREIRVHGFIARRDCQRCPGCKNVIEKNGGCNHMTCHCGHEFCWICSSAWRGGCTNKLCFAVKFANKVTCGARPAIKYPVCAIMAPPALCIGAVAATGVALFYGAALLFYVAPKTVYKEIKSASERRRRRREREARDRAMRAMIAGIPQDVDPHIEDRYPRNDLMPGHIRYSRVTFVGASDTFRQAATEMLGAGTWNLDPEVRVQIAFDREQEQEQDRERERAGPLDPDQIRARCDPRANATTGRVVYLAHSIRGMSRIASELSEWRQPARVNNRYERLTVMDLRTEMMMLVPSITNAFQYYEVGMEGPLAGVSRHPEDFLMCIDDNSLNRLCRIHLMEMNGTIGRGAALRMAEEIVAMAGARFRTSQHIARLTESVLGCDRISISFPSEVADASSVDVPSLPSSEAASDAAAARAVLSPPLFFSRQSLLDEIVNAQHLKRRAVSQEELMMEALGQKKELTVQPVRALKAVTLD